MSERETWRLFAAQWYGISKVAEYILESERSFDYLEETFKTQYTELEAGMTRKLDELDAALNAQYDELEQRLDGRRTWMHPKPETAKA